MKWVLLPLMLITATVPEGIADATQGPLVALASSFRELWPELVSLYTEQTGQPAPRASFASSGLLSSQIRHGAPFELYLSADEATVAMLEKAGKTRDAGVHLADGTVSLISLQPSAESSAHDDDIPPASPLTPLQKRLDAQQEFRLAIPNPSHAPYGVAAREALQDARLWPLPAGYLLNAENAAQTLQFALTGAVDYAIVPDTLLQNPPPRLTVMTLPPGSYQPVAHTMVLLDTAGKAAESLFLWLQSDTAASVLARHGLQPDL